MAFSIKRRGDGGSWREHVGNFSPGSLAFGHERADAELVVDIPFADMPTAVLRILGYSEIKGNRLHRVNPIRHPQFEYMNAVSINRIQNLLFDGFTEESPLHPDSEPRDPIEPIDPTKAPSFARWKESRFHISFAPLLYKTLEDDEIDDNDESARNTTVQTFPSTSILSVEGNEYQFLDAPFTGSAFDGGMSLIQPTAQIVVTWFRVPLSWVTNKAGVMANILNLQGCVNKTTWKGYPPGTLLYESPEITYYHSPCPPEISFTPTTELTIRFLMRWADPPRHPSNTGTTFDARGHCLVPAPAGTTGANAGYFYKCRKGDPAAPGAPTLYRAAEFRDLFKRPTG